MRRAPGFSIAAVLTVALGIGATTAMFSVVYGVLLHPLPYGDPDRLVNIWSTAPSRGLPRAYVGMANVNDWKARNHSFEDIAAARPIANFNLVGQTPSRSGSSGRGFHRICCRCCACRRCSAGTSPRTKTGSDTSTWRCSATDCGAAASAPIERSSAAKFR
jgi:hypothetical protein